MTANPQMTPEELAKMRQKMEEEIRAQLMANQEMLNDNAQNWDEKVCKQALCLFPTNHDHCCPRLNPLVFCRCFLLCVSLLTTEMRKCTYLSVFAQK